MGIGFRTSTLLAFCLHTPLALASPGDPDLTYGDRGWVRLTAIQGEVQALSAIPDNDDVLAVVKYVNAPGADLIRLNADGTLDSTFGNAGQATITNAQNDQYARYDIRVLDASTVLVASPADVHAFDVGTGAPKALFGQVSSSMVLNSASQAVVLTDTSAVIAYGANGNVVMQQYPYSTGQVDSAFGTNGLASVRVATDADITIKDMDVYPDGRVVAIGDAVIGNSAQKVIARVLPDGAADSSFGANASGSMTRGGSFFVSFWLSIQATQDRLFVNGQQSGVPVFEIFDDESVDQTVSTSSNYSQPNLIKLDTGGFILLSTYFSTISSASGTYDFSIRALDPDGHVSSAFGANGSTFDYFGESDRPRAAAVLNSGDLLIGGVTDNQPKFLKLQGPLPSFESPTAMTTPSPAPSPEPSVTPSPTPTPTSVSPTPTPTATGENGGSGALAPWLLLVTAFGLKRRRTMATRRRDVTKSRAKIV